MVPHKLLVRRAGRGRRRVEERRRDLARFDHVEERAKKRRVHLEAALVEAVSHDIEHVLHQGEQEVLVEDLRELRRASHVLQRVGRGWSGQGRGRWAMGALRQRMKFSMMVF